MLTYPYAVPTTLGSAGWNKDITPAADVATQVPTTSNGGITNGGKTYTFHIKHGVEWNSSPARPVTRGRLHPRVQGLRQPGQPGRQPLYYTATIAGMDAVLRRRDRVLREEESTRRPRPTSPTSRTRTPSPGSPRRTRLDAAVHTWSSRPRTSCTCMAMPFASARPVEYDSYVPNSAQLNQHIDVRRPLPDHLERAGQVAHDDQEPGLEAVYRPDPAPVRQRGHADDRGYLGHDPAGR